MTDVCLCSRIADQKTYTGKLGGLQDDACIAFQLVMAAMRTFWESPEVCAVLAAVGAGHDELSGRRENSGHGTTWRIGMRRSDSIRRSIAPTWEFLIVLLAVVS